MEWKRSAVLALAHYSCTHCHGLGLMNGRYSGSVINPVTPRLQPCNCVLRNIFETCYKQFQKHKEPGEVTRDWVTNGVSCSWVISRKTEEYAADFCLVAKRILGSQFEYPVFTRHFVEEHPWDVCCATLRINKGQFWHLVYRVMQKLGKAYTELEPYALYPLQDYFTHYGKDQKTPIRQAIPQVQPRLYEWTKDLRAYVDSEGKRQRLLDRDRRLKAS